MVEFYSEFLLHYSSLFLFCLFQSATVTVGSWCDTGVSVQYGHQIGNYSCAVMDTQVLEARCSVMTEPCHRFLDLTGPLQIGGLPGLVTEFQSQSTDFEGCIRNVHIDEEFLDLKAFTYNNGTVEGCPAKKLFCVPNPCKHGGMCPSFHIAKTWYKDHPQK